MSEKIVTLNEEVIKGQIKELVRGSVEETLNEQLAPLFPCVRPRAVGKRVAYRIVGDGLPVIRGQLVLPVAVRVRVGNKKGMVRG